MGTTTRVGCPTVDTITRSRQRRLSWWIHCTQPPPHNSFGYPGPPSSPAGYNNNSNNNPLPPQHHSSPSPHPGQQPGGTGPGGAGAGQTGPMHHGPPPPHHMSTPGSNNPNNNQNMGSPHPASNGAGGGPITPHWQQQLQLAHASRQSSSPHHNARAAHLAARGQTTSAIAIQSPADRPATSILQATQGKVLTYGAPGGLNGRREGSGKDDGSSNGGGFDTARSASVASTRTTMSSSTRDPKDLNSTSPTAAAAELSATSSDTNNRSDKNTWTTIDMGGMNLKNISIELFRYTFLTTLFIPHNALTTIPSAVSRLVNLTLLDASANKLTSLPVELGLLTHLRELLLFDNHLTSLPPELGTLHLLETLGIEGNPLPDQIRSLLEKEGTSSLIAYLRDSCPVPLPPPERDWVTIEPDSFPNSLTGANKMPEETFSVLCYNILCEKYATGQIYGYTPSWALSWEYRKELILQEVMNYAADILCLQVRARKAILDTRDWAADGFALVSAGS